MKKVINLIKKTFSKWSEDKASRLAAALAYYAAFSLGPILVIVIAVVGLFYSEASVQEQIVNQVNSMAGSEAGDLVSSMLEASRNMGSNLLAVIIGVMALIFGAIGVFGQLQDALDTIWNVEEKPGGGVLGMIKERLFSFALVIGIGVLLLISLVISAALTALQTWTTGLIPGNEIVMQIVNQLVSFLIITLMFALLFKYVPHVKIAWRDVWLGAAVTALLFSIGKYLIGMYLGSGGAVSQFGAAGSLVVILLWVYYSAQIIFLGAEFTQVYANNHGSRVVPDENAVSLSYEQRLAQGRKKAQTGMKPAPALGVSRGQPHLPPPDRLLVSREQPLVPLFSLVSLLIGLLTGFILSLLNRSKR